MLSDEIRQKLQNIIRGNVLEGQGDANTTVRNLLCQSFGAGPTVKREFENKIRLKKEQAGFIENYAKNNGLWFSGLPSGSQYLTRGGESVVYLAADHRHVLKLNDAVYYATWLEYFDSVAIHNLLFPATEYNLFGFTRNSNGHLSLILSQLFIEGEQANLADIKDYLVFNGFQREKRQDYYNNEFGLILEDMHDENVIAKSDTLFFIDTVFYIMASDY